MKSTKVNYNEVGRWGFLLGNFFLSYPAVAVCPLIYVRKMGKHLHLLSYQR